MAVQQAAQWKDPWSASMVASGATVSGAYEKLTSRELEVALVVAEGRSNRDIASRLFISQKTVEFHLGNVFGKLGVNSRTQLALALIRVPSQGTPLDERPTHTAPGAARTFPSTIDQEAMEPLSG
jgi:DNA-binding NarL/FixJ family response regulator